MKVYNSTIARKTPLKAKRGLARSTIKRKPQKVSQAEKLAYKECAEEQTSCQLCGSTQQLHIHHIRFGAPGRKTYRGNLIRLCLSCHDKVHSNDKKWRPILIELVDKINGG